MNTLSQAIRRLAVLVRCGQDWKDLPVAALESEWKAWMQAARCSPDPETILLRLADFCEQTARLRRQARLALIYPRWVLLTLLGVCVWLAWVPGPAFLEALGVGSQSPLLLSALAMVPLALLVLVCYRWLGQAGWQGAWVGSRLASEVDQILWCSSLAHFLELDVDLGTALTWVAEPLRPSSREAAQELSRQHRAGASLSQALGGLSWDPLIAWAARAGEEHQTLPQALVGASACLEEALEQRIQRQLALLQPLALVLVGILIALTFSLFWTAYGQVTQAVLST